MHQSAFCFKKPPTKRALELRRKAQQRHKPIITKKRPNPFGKAATKYGEWRDTVAIPYLTKTFGYRCVMCGSTDNLDVDHIKKRGSHPELKYSLENVRFLCRPCHIKIT